MDVDLGDWNRRCAVVLLLLLLIVVIVGAIVLADVAAAKDLGSVEAKAETLRKSPIKSNLAFILLLAVVVTVVLISDADDTECVLWMEHLVDGAVEEYQLHCCLLHDARDDRACISTEERPSPAALIYRERKRPRTRMGLAD